MRKLFITVACFLATSSLFAQRTSFAIVIDQPHLEVLQTEVNEYKTQLEKDGLKVHILSIENQQPVYIREELQKLYKNAQLEGAVFIGNIPVPMVRDAQHLTSTYKMPQDLDWVESSVPSDRYYDDFDLQFEFLKQDETRKNLFYYSLRPESRHKIEMDIYTGRIKGQSADLKESALQIRNYLTKVIEDRRTNKALQHVLTYTGEGYNSNAVNSWSSLTLGYREQFALLFQYPNSVRFIEYRSHEIVKPKLLTALRNPNIGFAYLNGHGLPTEFIISGGHAVSSPTSSLQNVSYYVRENMRNTDEAKRADKKASLQKNLGLNDKWFDNAFDPAQIITDSIYKQTKTLSIDDIKNVEINAKIVYLDACFTGAYQYDEFLAGQFPLHKGKNLVTIANSVGVLQDLWANEMIGLLQNGTRVGQILKHTAYLETHLFGDPTYHFEAKNATDWNADIALTTQPSYWTKKLASPLPDVTNLSLAKIARFEKKEKAIEILKKHFYQSKNATVRTEAYKQLKGLQPSDWHQITIDASKDNFEYLRRIATYEMGEIGDEAFIQPLIELYFNDRASNRTAFNVERMLLYFDNAKVTSVINNYYDKHADMVDSEYVNELKSKFTGDSYFDKSFSSLNKTTAQSDNVPFILGTLRAYRFHKQLPTVFEYLTNNLESEKKALVTLEALSWFKDSIYKKDIIAVCQTVKNSEKASEKVKKEANRTIQILSNSI